MGSDGVEGKIEAVEVSVPQGKCVRDGLVYDIMGGDPVGYVEGGSAYEFRFGGPDVLMDTFKFGGNRELC